MRCVQEFCSWLLDARSMYYKLRSRPPTVWSLLTSEPHPLGVLRATAALSHAYRPPSTDLLLPLLRVAPSTQQVAVTLYNVGQMLLPS